MRKKIAIIGGSIGGLITSVLLRKKGYEVTIFERSSELGGMYSKVETPFGKFELGMHVLYVNTEQKKVLFELYGDDYFLEKTGVNVDLGASFLNGTLNIESIYPNVINTKYSSYILEHLKNELLVENAHSSVISTLDKRFGKDYTASVVVRILEGLWREKAELLSSGAIHCFYDLRRVVAVNHAVASKLKTKKNHDDVIAWPNQKKTIGQIYENRSALFLRYLNDEPKLVSNLKKHDVSLFLDQNIKLENNVFYSNDINLNETYDGIILTAPIHSLINKDVRSKVNYRKLVIYYFQLERSIKNSVPVYYVLGHDDDVLFSRLVNYDAYNNEKTTNVVSVEIVFDDEEPNLKDVIKDIERIHPSIKIKDYYKYPSILQIPMPTINNNKIFEQEIINIKNNLEGKYFKDSGMRTDLGRFFSHDTIREAYNATLEL